MRRNDQDELWRDCLAGDEVQDFKQEALAQMLVAVRRRKRRQHMIRLGALAIIPAAALLAFYFRPHEMVSPIQSVSASPTVKPAAPPQQQPVGIISDEELFALFPGRSMALIGRPGDQRLIFLDHKRAKTSTSSL